MSMKAECATQVQSEYREHAGDSASVLLPMQRDEILSSDALFLRRLVSASIG